MLSLPLQVLEKIFILIGSGGILKLMTLNRQFYQIMVPYVYKQIKIIWHDLSVAGFHQFINKYKGFIEKLRIVDCYGYGEWQLDSTCIFDLDLYALEVNSYNSSNWLKYKYNYSLKSLKMYHDPIHNETESIYTNPNPKNINRVKSTNVPKIFNLTHLGQFNQLHRLDLTNYHFNWDDTVTSPIIKFLSLTNCTWEYPFTLNKFNETNSLLTLNLIYSGDNLFVLLERFGKFLTTPLQCGSNIEQITIHFINYKCKRTLSINQLQTFLKFPKLHRLDLRTWNADLNSITRFIDTYDHRYLVDELLLDGL